VSEIQVLNAQRLLTRAQFALERAKREPERRRYRSRLASVRAYIEALKRRLKMEST
jgi:hypothetical protein